MVVTERAQLLLSLQETLEDVVLVLEAQCLIRNALEDAHEALEDFQRLSLTALLADSLDGQKLHVADGHHALHSDVVFRRTEPNAETGELVQMLHDIRGVAVNLGAGLTGVQRRAGRADKRFIELGSAGLLVNAEDRALVQMFRVLEELCDSGKQYLEFLEDLYGARSMLVVSLWDYQGKDPYQAENFLVRFELHDITVANVAIDVRAADTHDVDDANLGGRYYDLGSNSGVIEDTRGRLMFAVVF